MECTETKSEDPTLTLTFYGRGNLLLDEWDPDWRKLPTSLAERIVFNL
jgi:hypothetical protein